MSSVHRHAQQAPRQNRVLHTRAAPPKTRNRIKFPFEATLVKRYGLLARYYVARIVASSSLCTVFATAGAPALSSAQHETVLERIIWIDKEFVKTSNIGATLNLRDDGLIFTVDCDL